MATSWYAGNDVAVDPTFQGGDVEFIVLARNRDRAGDLGDESEVDTQRLLILPIGQPSGDGGYPPTQPTTQPRPESAGSHEDSLDVGAPDAVESKFKIVDLADEAPVGIDHLPIEQVQLEVQRPCLGHYCPAFVQIISGIAATDATTMMMRKMLARKLVTRPFDLSPM
jgi:hypothetical protein